MRATVAAVLLLALAADAGARRRAVQSSGRSALEIYVDHLRTLFATIEPPAAGTRIRFEAASDGLPVSGSWRNSLDVADFNGDGFADIVAPPQRGPAAFPSIFLGDGNGSWTEWKEAKWDAPFNYGAAAAADFNQDGHVDVAFGVHLDRVAVFLGDGKGRFRRIENGLGEEFPTRRIITADVDADGWTDVVAIGEGPSPIGGGTKSNLRAYLNRAGAEWWEPFDIAQPRDTISGDALSAGDFNRDRFPDFAGSSVVVDGPHTLYLSDGQPLAYRAHIDPERSRRPFGHASYAMGTTTGPFTSSGIDDAVVGFVRFWPDRDETRGVPPPEHQRVTGLDLVTFAGGEMKRTPIARWGAAESLWGVARGDFDGDGNLDVAYTRSTPRELVILLGDGRGAFRRASVEGVTIARQLNYHLKSADVNGDGRPDLIVMYEADEPPAPRNGKIEVFLNRGVE